MELTTDDQLPRQRASAEKLPARSVNVQCVKGLHESASHSLAENQWLLLGTAEDCDILLSDPGVMAHHCLLGYAAGQLTVRALQGNVIWAGKTLASGEMLQQRAWGELQIGEAVFCFGSKSAGRTSKLRATLQPLRLGVFGLVLTSIATYGMSMSISLFDGNNATAAASLVTPVQPGSTPAQSDAGSAPGKDSGRRLTRSLKEVMRLSGFNAESRYLGDGVVEVSGYFSDGDAVAALVRSRAVREIDGLKKVQIVNYASAPVDPTPSAPIAEPVAGAKVVKIIFNEDPYLVYPDGSRYYPGAHLPDGSDLVAILDGSEVLIKAATGASKQVQLDELIGSLQ